MPRYTYEVKGTASRGQQTWTTKGTVETANLGEFMTGLEQAMAGTFMQLTNGEAVYGRPGVGCAGPYTIIKFTFELKG